MSDPVLTAAASKVSGSIVAGISSRLKVRLLGTEERRALDRAVSRAFSGLVIDTPSLVEAINHFPLDYYLGREELATILVRSAFYDIEPDRHEIATQLRICGYDETTSPIDVSGLAIEFSTRLRSEIRQDADQGNSPLFNRMTLATLDRIIDSLQPASSRSAINLPPLPSLVVGRDKDLEAVRSRLRTAPQMSAAMVVTVVRGWPGVGKSTLVARVAHDPVMQEDFRGGVLWAALGEIGRTGKILTDWIKLLDATPIGAPADIPALSSQLAGLLRGRQVLLIADDIWEAEQAMPLLVGGLGSAALLTTRSTDIGHRLAPTPGDVYVLEVLDETAGLALLQILAPGVVGKFPAASRELVREVEGLPLALQVAGRLLSSEAHLGLGVTELLTDLRESSKILSSKAPSDRMDLISATTPTVAALLARSTNRLSRKMRERFAALGMFEVKPADFNVSAIAEVWHVTDPRPGIRILVGRGLLEPTKNGRFQMHALLAMHAKMLAEEL